MFIFFKIYYVFYYFLFYNGSNNMFHTIYNDNKKKGVFMSYKEIKNKYLNNDTQDLPNLYNQATMEDIDDYSEDTLLHLAASYGDARAIQQLIEKGFDVNASNYQQERPLHTLLNHADDLSKEALMDCLNQLLDHKASILRKNREGKTPAHIAAEHLQADVLQAFIDRGLKLNLTDGYENNLLCSISYNYREDQKELALLQVVSALMETGLDPKEYNRLSKNAIDIANDRQSHSLLAVYNGTFNFDQPEDKTSIYAGMSLHNAIINKDYKALEEILNAGANVNEISQEPDASNKLTPLQTAVYYIDLKAVELLLKHQADCNYKNEEGQNCLAVWPRHNGDLHVHFDNMKDVMKILQLLYQSGLNIDDTIDELGNTALISACKYINRATGYNGTTIPNLLIQFLISKHCDVNKTNLEGTSALMHLCQFGSFSHQEQILELLENDANVSLVDTFGNTALIYACKNKDAKAAREFSSLLFDFDDPNLEHRNNEGQSALEIAVANNNEALVNLLIMKG